MNKAWDKTYITKWDERYKETEFVYGQAPNEFFKDRLKQFKPKRILMPADGEGRNGVYAAQLGWEVKAFDLSIEGKLKATQLANSCGVSIDYKVSDLEDLELKPESFDAIGLIYAHFSAQKKSIFHKKLDQSLKSGGVIILEAFSKKHLLYNTANPKVGGPKDLDMLYSIREIETDFKGYEILYLKEEVVDLNEGLYHIGKGSVIRFIGRKKS